MTNEILHNTALALQQEMDLVLPETMSEEALLQLLADKLASVIARGPEPFFTLMYRLDIPEKKLTAVLAGGHAAMSIARLVYERQIQKVQSRLSHKANKVNDDPDLEW